MKNLIAVIVVAGLFTAGTSLLHPAQSEAEGKKPVPPDAESVRLIDSLDGAALYRAYCAVCHGSDARGDGPMAASLKVTPPDLTGIAARNGGGYPMGHVERIISGEQQLPGGHGTRAMPVWGPIFSQIAWDQDLGRLRVHNLATYIGRLQSR